MNNNKDSCKRDENISLACISKYGCYDKNDDEATEWPSNEIIDVMNMVPHIHDWGISILLFSYASFLRSTYVLF